MQNCREIITLQFGHYANFVGTHFWNIQSDCLYHRDETNEGVDFKTEIDFRTLFREGITRSGEETVTPRVVVFDLKDSLNSLNQEGNLYRVKKKRQKKDERNLAWGGPLEVHEQEKEVKNSFLKFIENQDKLYLRSKGIEEEEEEEEDDEKDAFQEKNINQERKGSGFNLDSDVRVWSDFLKQPFHPKTIHILPSFSHLEVQRFNLFGLGVEKYKREREGLEERLRFFAEECDSLQGFHLILDPSNAFSGFSSSFYEDYLSDEYANKGAWLFNVMDKWKGEKKDFPVNLFNLFLTYSHFSPASSITCSSLFNFPPSSSFFSSSQSFSSPFPTSSIQFPHLSYNPSLPYHTSAILAAAFSTASLPYRLHSNKEDLKQYFLSMATSTNNFYDFNFSFPFFNSISMGDNLNNNNNINNNIDLISLTPWMDDKMSPIFQNISISGLRDSQIWGGEMVRRREREEVLHDFFSRKFNSHYKFKFNFSKLPLIITDPFPKIINQSEENKSFKLESITNKQIKYYLPSITSLSNTTGVSKHLQEVMEGVEKLKKQKINFLVEGWMEKDDLEEKIEKFKVNLENINL